MSLVQNSFLLHNNIDLCFFCLSIVSCFFMTFMLLISFFTITIIIIIINITTQYFPRTLCTVLVGILYLLLMAQLLTSFFLYLRWLQFYHPVSVHHPQASRKPELVLWKKHCNWCRKSTHLLETPNIKTEFVKLKEQWRWGPQET